MFFVFGTVNKVQAATYEDTFTSQVIDNNYPAQYGDVSWTENIETNTSIVVKVRTDSSSDMSGATAWDSCSAVTNNTDISSNDCVSDNDRYLQYQVTLGTDNLANTPTFYDISFETNVSVLISSKYNTDDSTNQFSDLTWAETLNDGDVFFQVRSSADGSTWSDWCGVDNATSTCNTESFFTNFNFSDIDDLFSDMSNDQYMQYKAILVADSVGDVNTPEVSQIDFEYSPPTTISRTYEDTYTSKVYNVGTPISYGKAYWSAYIPSDTSFVVKIRTSTSSDMTSISTPDWTTCDYITNDSDISSNNCVTDGEQYVQYQVTLGTDDLSKTPTMYFMGIYAENDGSNLLSSIYDTGAQANVMSGPSWDESFTYAGVITLYMRTASTSSALESSSWSEIASSSAPSGALTTGCTKVGDTVSCDSSVIPDSMKDVTDERYFQYKLNFQDIRGGTTTVSSVSMVYVVNARPEVRNFSFATSTAGTIGLSYEARDADTDGGTYTPYELSPSFEYTLDGGSTWYDATEGCFTSGTYDNKTVATGTWSGPYTTTWTPKCEASTGSGKYSTTTQVRITLDDNEAALNTVTSVTSEFVLDTTSPVPAADAILIDARLAVDSQAVPVTLEA
ncbi:hypothetical protein K8R62_03840, partial [bacterium]|nr:hypothetical protein [bacterium]